MEKAIVINDYKKIKHKPKLKDFDRFYYGNEFCPYLIPDITEVNENIEFLKKYNKPISFLTPYIDNGSLERIESIIKNLTKSGSIDEIIVNDFGLYYFCRKKTPSLKIVAGRLISKLLTCGAYVKLKIDRIEKQDDWSLAMIKKIKNIKISLYTPYIIIQGTKHCIFNGKKNQIANAGMKKCDKVCLKIGKVKLQNTFIDSKTFLIGNVQLLKAPKIDLKNIDKNIDRIIFQEY